MGNVKTNTTIVTKDELAKYNEQQKSWHTHTEGNYSLYTENSLIKVSPPPYLVDNGFLVENDDHICTVLKPFLFLQAYNYRYASMLCAYKLNQPTDKLSDTNILPYLTYNDYAIKTDNTPVQLNVGDYISFASYRSAYYSNGTQYYRLNCHTAFLVIPLSNE